MARTFKPFSASVISRPLDLNRRNHMVYGVMIGTRFNDPTPINEQALMPLLQEHLQGTVLDPALPKPRGEVLMVGKAIAPGGHPTEGMAVSLRCGDIRKRLAVWGRRFWEPDPDHPGLMRISAPESFVEMPVSYANAYGGAGWMANPTGKGADAEARCRAGEVVELPNIEDPREPILDVRTVPTLPAGFAPMDLGWSYRQGKAGTFDEKWQKEQAPSLPRDMDPTLFNGGAPDQWLAGGYFRGDETFDVTGFHEHGRAVEGRLPGLRGRIFLTRGSMAVFEAPTRLDTVFLFPNIELCVTLHRAMVPCDDLDGEDIDHVIVAVERMGDDPRPPSHYQAFFEERYDRLKSAHLALDDSPLLPILTPAEVAQRRARRAAAEQAVRDQMDQRFGAGLNMATEALGMPPLDPAGDAGQAAAMLREKGMDSIAEVFDEPMPIITAEDFKQGGPELVDKFETMNRIMDKLKKAGEELMAPGAAEELGRRLMPPKSLERLEALPQPAPPEPAEWQAALEARAAGQGGGLTEDIMSALDKAIDKLDALPPAPEGITVAPPSAEPLKGTPLEGADPGRMLAALEGLEDPETAGLSPVEKLRAGRQKVADLVPDALAQARRLSPVPVVPGDPLPPDQAAWLGQRVLARLKAGEAMAGRELADVDLARADLNRADLAGAFMERADLTGAELCRIRADKLVLTGARMDRAVVRESDLSGANLARVSARRAAFVRSNLTGASLWEGDLEHADLSQARLEKVLSLKGRFSHARFLAAELTATKFIDADFSGAFLAGARINKALFLNCNFAGARFDQVTMKDGLFINCNLSGASFNQAQLEKMRVVGESTLTGADFDRITARGCIWRKMDMTGVHMRDSDVDGCDFSEARLAGAVMSRSLLKNSMFMGTDLIEAVLDSVNLHRSRLRRADCRRTRFTGASMFFVEMAGGRFDAADFTHVLINQPLPRTDVREQ